jgi:hypothetical protein
LNLSGVLLTAERLAKLPAEVFADVNEIRFGTLEGPSVAAELVERCKRAEYVESREMPLDDEATGRLSRHPTLRSLKVVQGQVPAQRFHAFATSPRFKWLEIYRSTYSPCEARQIREAICVKGADVFVDVFRGFGEKLGDSILAGEK